MSHLPSGLAFTLQCHYLYHRKLILTIGLNCADVAQAVVMYF